MQKEAVVVILDVGKSLRENVGSGEFQNALTAVSLLVRDKLVEKPGKVLISLIFMGTKASNNSLHENGDDEGGASKGYEHISVVYDMAPPNVELAKFISNSTPQELLNEIGGSSGDFVDSLVIALDMLSVRAEDKAYSKKIFLITDAGSNADFQLLDPIIEKFTNLGCSLNGM